MLKRNFIFLFLFFSLLASSQSISKKTQTKIDQLGLHGVDMVASEKNVKLLISFCDTNTDNLIFPNYYLENLLALQYQFAKKYKLEEYQLKLAYPLASIYHDQSKFSKELPVLIYLQSNLNKLSSHTQKYVLVKLEQAYRATNELGNAIEIRKIRLNRGEVTTVWEIYRDCELYNDAIYDYRMNQPFPKKYNIIWFNYFAYFGDLFFDNNEIDSAIKYYKIGLQNANENLSHLAPAHADDRVDATFWIGNFTASLAKCNMAKGYYAKAIQPLLFDLASNEKSPENKTFTWLLLSECYLEVNDLSKSKLYYDSAQNDMTGKSNKRDLVKFYKLSTKYYSKIHKNDSALYYSQKYIAYMDLLHSNVQKNQVLLSIGQLEIKKNRADLEATKKSLIIEKSSSMYQKNYLLFSFFFLFATIIFIILLYQTIIVKTKNNKIIALEVERNDLLLKELHHRVKNNLQVMYSLLNMQKRRNESESTKAILTSVQNRIQTMALVHQNLYTSENFETVEVTTYVHTLVNHLKMIYPLEDKNVAIHFGIDPNLKLPMEQIISLGLIVNEVVSNSFKYAYIKREIGTLVIRINKINGTYLIEIKDDGPGIEKSKIDLSSLGLKLINLMSEQLKAEHVYTFNNNGVAHYFKFRLDHL